MREKTIDILIPTFNRERDLEKNLALLTDVIKSDKLEERINIIVSDNCSVDNTGRVVQKFQKKNDWIFYFKQKENVGLEQNAVFCLKIAKSDFVMYLGDDDFLPRDYLKTVVDYLDTKENITSIIPGCRSVFPDGSEKVFRSERFGEKIYSPSFSTTLKLIDYGHQLSGLLFKRDGILMQYLNKSELRNIYPFISFLGLNLKRGKAIYIPNKEVKITQGNAKDWGYDHSGLLTEMFKNFDIVYPESSFRRSLLQINLMIKQYGRVRVKNLRTIIKTFKVFLSSKETQILTKIFLLPIIGVVVIKKIVK